MKARRSVEEMSAREKINIGTGRENTANEYYKKVSKRYRLLKFITLFVLIIYTGVMLGMYHSEITYDNLMYLIKDLDTDVSSSTQEFADISFDETSRLSLALYHDRLALCSSESFRLYNTAGASEMEYAHSMESPAVTSGDKYVMAYDIGGNTYSIYTTIARVLTKQTDYPIQDAAMSKVGEYAVVSRARENRYVVSFYDRNFREISKVYKDKYVMTTALSDDGKNYCIASCEVVRSDFACDVMFGNVRSENSSSVTVEGALPLKSGFFSDGTFVVICDTAVLFFDNEGSLVSTYKLSGITLSQADIAYDRVLIIGKENIVGDTSVVTVLAKDASPVLRTVTNGKMNAAALGEKHVFEAVSGSCERISFDGAREGVDCPLNVISLVPTGSSVMICTSDGCTCAFTAAPEEEEPSDSDGASHLDDTSEVTANVDLTP